MQKMPSMSGSDTSAGLEGKFHYIRHVSPCLVSGHNDLLSWLGPNMETN